MNYVLTLETVEDPPLSEYSTQSITLLDGTIYAVQDSTSDSTGAPDSSPTDQGDSGATSAVSINLIALIFLVIIAL